MVQSKSNKNDQLKYFQLKGNNKKNFGRMHLHGRQKERDFARRCVFKNVKQTFLSLLLAEGSIGVPGAGFKPSILGS
jgi:hypothetical protein